jgi:hypothetical protein
MSKLLEDPKVATLVEKEVAKAVKAERARTAAIMKTLAGELKEATTAVKNPASFDTSDAA